MDEFLILRPSDIMNIDCYVDADFAGLWPHEKDGSILCQIEDRFRNLCRELPRYLVFQTPGRYCYFNYGRGILCVINSNERPAAITRITYRFIAFYHSQRTSDNVSNYSS
jgi:hypothetical protein